MNESFRVVSMFLYPVLYAFTFASVMKPGLMLEVAWQAGIEASLPSSSTVVFIAITVS